MDTSGSNEVDLTSGSNGVDLLFDFFPLGSKEEQVEKAKILYIKYFLAETAKQTSENDDIFKTVNLLKTNLENSIKKKQFKNTIQDNIEDFRKLRDYAIKLQKDNKCTFEISWINMIAFQTISIPANIIRIFDSKEDIEEEMQILYNKHKDVIKKSRKISLNSFSLGALRCAAFLKILAKNGDSDKIVHVVMQKPLTSTKSDRIGKIGSGFVKLIRGLKHIASRSSPPSIKKYFKDISKATHTFPNAKLVMQFGSRDTVVKHSDDQKERYKNNFCSKKTSEETKNIFKDIDIHTADLEHNPPSMQTLLCKDAYKYLNFSENVEIRAEIDTRIQSISTKNNGDDKDSGGLLDINNKTVFTDQESNRLVETKISTISKQNSIDINASLATRSKYH